MAARVDRKAKNAFSSFCLDVRSNGRYLTENHLAELLCVALGEPHFRQCVSKALESVELQPEDTPAHFSALISPRARAIFDQFVQDVLRTHPSAGYLYQVVQGVCLTLECPDVRAVLLPWIDQHRGEAGGG